MGFNLTVGDAMPRYPDEKHNSFGWTVREVCLPDAPAIPNDAPWSQHGNQRSPLYTVWEDFTRSTGLEDLLGHTDSELIPYYPGVAPLTRAHADRVDAALVAFHTAHPEAVARFSAEMAWGGGSDTGEHDGHLARLTWLAWWIRWAVENCAHPAFEAR